LIYETNVEEAVEVRWLYRKLR